MQTLTNLDTSFLHLETKQTPLHVGGVSVSYTHLTLPTNREG